MITDWDDAYKNGAYIDGADTFRARWSDAAQAFREKLQSTNQAQLDMAYGPDARHQLDLYLPDKTPTGLIVFVHGGYWIDFDKSSWSHLAKGGIASGWAVAIPSYTLAPEKSLACIAEDIASAIKFAAQQIEGPIVLVGHSAGGQLVTRMACKETPLAPAIQSRLKRVMTISGLHDLGPLMRTEYKTRFGLTPDIVSRESPANQQPVAGVDIISWVGGDERPEFIRQTLLLAKAWSSCEVVMEPDRHHFNVIDGLADPASPMCQRLLA